MATKPTLSNQSWQVLLDSVLCMIFDFFADFAAGKKCLGICHIGQHQLQHLQRLTLPNRHADRTGRSLCIDLHKPMLHS